MLGFGTETIGTDAGQGFHQRPPYPCHYYMHGAGRYGLQCLTNLDLLPATGAVVVCPPLKIEQGSGSPLRVLALVARAGATRLAVVTGGSAGIGLDICVTCWTPATGCCRWRGARPTSVIRRRCRVLVDLADPVADGAAAQDIATRWPVTTVIHNAGVIRSALLPDVRLDDLNALVNLHLSSAIVLVQAALPAMTAAGFGRVILMSSRAALGLQTRTAYSATKAGMLGMARTWALELAPQGITVNVVAPGPIQTDMFWDVIPAGSDKEKQVAGGIPVRRIGRPDDVSPRRAVSLPTRATALSPARSCMCAAAPASAAYRAEPPATAPMWRGPRPAPCPTWHANMASAKSMLTVRAIHLPTGVYPARPCAARDRGVIRGAYPAVPRLRGRAVGCPHERRPHHPPALDGDERCAIAALREMGHSHRRHAACGAGSDGSTRPGTHGRARGPGLRCTALPSGRPLPQRPMDVR